MGKILRLISLLFFFTASCAWGGDLFVWDPGPGHPRIVLYATDVAHRREAVQNYLRTVNALPELKPLLPHPLDVPMGTVSSFQRSALSPDFIVTSSRFTDLSTIAPIGMRIQGVFGKISAFGGVPVLLPPGAGLGYPKDQRMEFRALVARNHFDGMLLLGGRDITPELYREPNSHAIAANRLLDEDELGFLNAFKDAEEGVITAFCRGHQLCTVAHDGKLVQDIPAQTGATLEHEHNSTHDIWIDEDSELHQVLGTRNARVNSLHHQEVMIPSDDPNLRVVARAAEMNATTVEAVEFRNGLGNTYQFHPELMNDDVGNKLMNAMVQKALRVKLARSFSQLLCGAPR